ncbi:hypothetical protein HDV06_001493 [Boothiomyces sp. JEL0866]|nr:hypothetical protein HDV06_001493 [Boothiomyces sp. JEL0866]
MRFFFYNVKMQDDEFIEKLLSNGRIKSKDWKKLTNEQREYILDSIDDENYSINILNDIAEENRVYNLPEDYINYQIKYKGKHNIPEYSSQEVQSSINMIEEEKRKLLEQQLEFEKEKLKFEKEKNVIVERHYEESYDNYDHNDEILDTKVYENERFILYEAFGYRNILSKLIIQPKRNDDIIAADYYHPILEIFNEENTELYRLVDGYICNIAIVIREPGNPQRLIDYVFSTSSMNIEDILYQLKRTLLMGEDEDGSDTYKTIKKYINHVELRIIKEIYGGCDDEKDCQFFDVFMIHCKTKLKNICMYKNLKQILINTENNILKITKYTRFEKIKQILFNLDDYDTNQDYKFNVNDLYKIKDYINIIVFNDTKPHMVICDKNLLFRDYDNIKRDYYFVYDVIYSNCDEIVNNKFKSNEKYEFIKDGTNKISYICFQNIPDKKFYTMVYHNEHFSIIKNMKRFSYCEKCLSEDHVYEDTKKNSFIKMKCLNNLKFFLSEEEYERQIPKKIYISYDYETHINNTKHFTHSVGFVVCDENKNILERNYFEGYNIERFFINYLDKKYKNYIKFMFAFNGSNFDHYFTTIALSAVLNCNLSSDRSIIAKNKILKIQTHGFILWDPRNFCKYSLKEACQAYGVEGKKINLNTLHIKELSKKFNVEYNENYQHEIISKLFEHYQYKNIIFDSEDWLSLNNKEYNMNDAEINMQLFWKLREEYKESTKKISIDKGLDIVKYSTISSIIYKFFDLKFTKLDYKYDEIFNEAMGGRTQAFEVGHFTDKYALLDINSSYPSIQIEYKMPDGEIIETNILNKIYKNNIYYCLCDVDQSNLKYKLVGKKENNINNWNMDKVKNIWLWKEEIITLEMYGAKVKKIKYLIWENQTDQLKPTQEFLREKRNELKNLQQECQKKLDHIFINILSIFNIDTKIEDILKNHPINIIDDDLQIYTIIYNKLLESKERLLNFDELHIVNIYEEIYNTLVTEIKKTNFISILKEKNKYKTQEKLIKLQSNGISGKCIEKNHLDTWMITRNHKVLETVVEWRNKYNKKMDFEIMGKEKFLLKGLKDESKKIKKPRHWGARILALGRLKLWKEMIKYSKILYCDTDSILVPYDEIDHNKLNSIEYGKWKIETITNNFYIISPKSYWLNENKNSLKGYSPEDIWEVREKLYISGDEMRTKNNDIIMIKDLDISLLENSNDKTYYIYKDTKHLVDSGKGRTEKLYKYLINNNYITITIFNKFVKRIVKKTDSNKWEFMNIKMKEIRKILV